MRRIILLIFIIASHSFCKEVNAPIFRPSTFFYGGGLIELQDDIYSGYLHFGGEFALCHCLSLYGDFSYRLLSYEFGTKFHNQIHEALNLQTNSFNEPYLGIKILPYSFAGVNINLRLPPGEGSNANRFSRLGISPFGLFDFSRGMLLAFGADYFTFLESNNFKPGDELGLKTSLLWHLFWNYERRTGFTLEYTFLYRFRIEESKNYNLEKPYQKMDDLYRGLKMRFNIGRYFSVFQNSFGVNLFYEMNRGNLFGKETGHTIGIYFKWVK